MLARAAHGAASPNPQKSLSGDPPTRADSWRTVTGHPLPPPRHIEAQRPCRGAPWPPKICPLRSPPPPRGSMALAPGSITRLVIFAPLLHRSSPTRSVESSRRPGKILGDPHAYDEVLGVPRGRRGLWGAADVGPRPHGDAGQQQVSAEEEPKALGDLEQDPVASIDVEKLMSGVVRVELHAGSEVLKSWPLFKKKRKK
ncbi:hypothetical protein ACQ4PT_051497 [Festuca glaucescens]